MLLPAATIRGSLSAAVDCLLLGQWRHSPPSSGPSYSSTLSSFGVTGSADLVLHDLRAPKTDRSNEYVGCTPTRSHPSHLYVNTMPTTAGQH